MWIDTFLKISGETCTSTTSVNKIRLCHLNLDRVSSACEVGLQGEGVVMDMLLLAECDAFVGHAVECFSGLPPFWLN